MLWGQKAKKRVCIGKVLDYSTLVRQFQQSQGSETKITVSYGNGSVLASLLHLIAAGGGVGKDCGKCREHHGDFRGQPVRPLVNYATICREPPHSAARIKFNTSQ